MDWSSFGLLVSETRPAIPGAGPQRVADVLDAGSPAGEALVGSRGRYTYAELDAAADRAAHALAALGLAPGDRIAVCLPNDVDIVVAFLGAMRLGAVWVGVNRALAPPEKQYLLSDSGASVFLATAEAAAQLRPHTDGLSALRHVVVIERENGPDEWSPRLSAAPGDPWPRDAVDAFEPAAIAYTSGTTGRPKGAVHSQHNMLLPGSVSRDTGRYPSGMRQGVVLPLTILNLVVLGPVSSFLRGTCCVCIDRVDPTGLAHWIETERVGNFAGVPTLFHDLLTHPEVRSEQLVSLERPEVGGAEMPEEFRSLYRERFGSDVRIGYGMTEAPTAVTWSDGRRVTEPGLCGTALPQVAVYVCDDQGDPLPQGAVGEICIGPAREGPWADVYTPMLGYWNKPQASDDVLRGGLYRSGDLGAFDADGRLFIRGRRNELILRGGANVYPAEVERAIREDSRVADCAVFGIADARLGQKVVAVVELESGTAVGEKELQELLTAGIARYKVPERIVFVDALPRNAMAKVVKRDLEPLFSDRGDGS